MTTYLNKKRVAIIANGKPQSKVVASILFTSLREDLNFYLTKKNPDIVISIGGDGTLLSAFHMYEKNLHRVKFVGIHTGHLGFYTDYRDFEVDTLLDNLKNYKTGSVSYPILETTVTLANGQKQSFLALNEATMRRYDKTMVADLVINNVKFEQFQGDGMTVSTPTGSTAYNKSLGGAVLHPTIEALQVTEVASLNNRVFRTLGSPVIVPKKDLIEIVPKRIGNYSISIDNKIYHFKEVERVAYRIYHKKIHFLATPRHTSFWNRVRDAFIGDFD